MTAHPDSFGAARTLHIADNPYQIYRLDAVEQTQRLPYAIKVLLENLLRHEDGLNVTAEHIRAVAQWDPQAQPSSEIPFAPARVVLQDFTGVPAVVDLATMREALAALGGDPRRINPLVPAELVIDHSVIVDAFGSPDALAHNMELEYQRNSERYQLLRWAQQAFDGFAVVPPGQGIVHQVNLEYLARVVMASAASGGNTAGDETTGHEPKTPVLYPDTCVGTDSHTTMINGLGVLGWGVGGIEAEAAMLGQSISMLVPQVVGVELTGDIATGATATDVVLTMTQMLRELGVVGKFVEFYGPGVAQLPVAHRATIGNMSPEFGSTCAIFPIDEVTLNYLRLTGRSESQLTIIEQYAKTQGLWHDPNASIQYSQSLHLDLSTVRPSIAGPKRPQDRIELDNAQQAFVAALPSYTKNLDATACLPDGDQEHQLAHGSVVIAAITSCTNTSNPAVMVAAGLLARNAVERGLTSKPWVKTSLAPGSTVVVDYLTRSGLDSYLDKLGFNVVGFGCTTCIGNSGPLPENVAAAVKSHDLVVAAVLSGNRNFEGRINPAVAMNYLASPPLVVAYALAGTMNHDFAAQPLGVDSEGHEVFLTDIWPSETDIAQTIGSVIDTTMFTAGYAKVMAGDQRWRDLPVPDGDTFTWRDDSTYVRKPPFFESLQAQPQPVRDITDARVLVWLGDSVTTDHISPAGSIAANSPAGEYLREHGVAPGQFNSYGSRRGNHEVMIRGTFANIRLRNKLVPEVAGGYTRNWRTGEQSSIYAAAMDYADQQVPLVVLAGKEYGSGSSRDWAAKGTALLGIRAVLAESFERIHRSNLIGMGVLPLQFPDGTTVNTLGLDGSESFTITGITALNDGPVPATVAVTATHPEGRRTDFEAIVRIDTPSEADYYRHGGILPYVLRTLATAAPCG